jgi:metallophosphoesterase (TIGR03767 family)
VGWAACGGGDEEGEPATTLDRTIALDAEGNPVYAAGEPYLVRTDVRQAQAGRETRRRSLSVFHHLSDFRILDEESPLRSEWSDLCEPPPNPTAFRPQETLSVQVAEALFAAANAIDRSTVTSRPVDFAFHTGNALDNAQYNELRWFLALMDAQPIYPDSGAIGYQGVQTESPAPAYGVLLEQAQRPFTPVGLKYPWYAVVGNRDVLAQGNFAYSENSNRFAVGAQKVMGLGADALAEACSNSETLLGPGSSATIFNDPDTRIRGVGSDANRRLLSLKQWMAEHFAGAEFPGPTGHGFSLQDLQSETPYYVVDAGSVHFIVLNTTNPGGYSSGSIGAAQYSWLEEQLIARSSQYTAVDGSLQTTANADRLIVIVSHHGLDSLDNPFPGIDPEEARVRGPEFESLLHRYPNVVLHVAGHSMTNAIRQRSSASGASYWEITTGAPLQAPMQGRLIEITDNRDGTLSIFSTVYDSAAPLNPGDAVDPTPDDGINQRLLAAVARQLALADRQRDPDAAGLAPSDRNAELLIAAPFDTTLLPTPSPVPQDLP